NERELPPHRAARRFRGVADRLAGALHDARGCIRARRSPARRLWGHGLARVGSVVLGVALWSLGPDGGDLIHQVVAPHKPGSESTLTYFYYAIALFVAALTPYEVCFFSSGGVEEKWTPDDIITARSNTFVGFPLGGAL